MTMQPAPSGTNVGQAAGVTANARPDITPATTSSEPAPSSGPIHDGTDGGVGVDMARTVAGIGAAGSGESLGNAANGRASIERRSRRRDLSSLC